jgi:hypothetical protein
MAPINEKDRNDIAVVVFANRKDFFLTKLCVASIRYYYPDVEIFLVKDYLNGNFHTSRLCKAFNVKLIPLGKRYFGWSAAKIFFLLNDKLPRRRYLCLDSDIIFIGKVLDKLNRENGDFVLHPEVYPQPFSDTVKEVFLDPEKVAPYYKEYAYPGFFFNAGQTVVKPGILKRDIFLPAFNPDVYPYYKNPNVFPLVDQSILNIVVSIMHKRKEITLSTIPYMLWSVDFFAEKDNQQFKKFADGSHEFLVHYAGDVRTPEIEKMKGFDLLRFFREFYMARLSKAGQFADRQQDKLSKSRLTRMLYYKNRIYIEIGKKLKVKK